MPSPTMTPSQATLQEPASPVRRSLIGVTVLLGVIILTSVSPAQAQDSTLENTPTRPPKEVEIEETARWIQAATNLREKYQADPYRPTYHFLPPEGIAHPFDPHACVYWKGKYHVFYQFNMTSPRFVSRWGHASSVDLVHWVHHPIALATLPEDPDKVLFAGNLFINKEGIPTIIYHGIKAGICLATSEDDDLIHWTKHPNNPVVPIPDPNPWVGRGDACGWLEGDTYYAILGNKANTPLGQGDIAYLYKSNDMVRWEKLHPFYESQRRWTDADEDCSCPDFFPLGDKHMLMFISHKNGVQYYLGSYAGETFVPERHGRMNWPGGPTFAQETLIDDKGRRIFWAWVCEWQTHEAQRANGWAGVLTLPRVLSLAHDGTLLIKPAEELEMLRTRPRTRGPFTLKADSEIVLDDIAGDTLELMVEADLGDAQAFGIKVRCSPDGAEQTLVVIDTSTKQLTIDTTNSSLGNDFVQTWPHPFASILPDPITSRSGENLAPPGGRQDVRRQEAPFELAAGERLTLRGFLDRSMLEVFANGRECMTQRIYPTRRDSTRILLFSKGGSVEVTSVEAWDMAAANQW